MNEPTDAQLNALYLQVGLQLANSNWKTSRQMMLMERQAAVLWAMRLFPNPPDREARNWLSRWAEKQGVTIPALETTEEPAPA